MTETCISVLLAKHFFLLSVRKVIIKNNEFSCKINSAHQVKTLTLLSATAFKWHKFASAYLLKEYLLSLP